MASNLSLSIGAYGDRLESVNLWRANVEVPEALAASRSSWTTDERRFLASLIGECSARNAQRIRRVSGEADARPYYDRAERVRVRDQSASQSQYHFCRALK
jgi:hypothetical protein